MKKRIPALVLALVMALSLAACGNSTKDDGVIRLTIWQPTDKEAVENWWVEKLEEWNSAHPELQVTREAIDRSDSYAYDNKIATAVTSRHLPDILFVDGPQVSYYAANKVTIPLDAYFPDTSDFAASTVAQCTYDGQLYAISATESSVAFYYNRDMLRECGVDVDDLDSCTIDNPITWSEMLDIAKKCTMDKYVGVHIDGGLLHLHSGLPEGQLRLRLRHCGGVLCDRGVHVPDFAEVHRRRLREEETL